MKVSSRIREDLLNRAEEFKIVLEDVSITHLTFGKEFTQVCCIAHWSPLCVLRSL